MRLVSTRALPLAFLLALPGPIARSASAQSVGDAPDGEAIYRSTCVNCHGPDGTGISASQVGFALPLPDFTDCNFGHREPDGDWLAVIHQGGPARAFSKIMPAFGEALAPEEAERVLAYVREFCGREEWPRGDLNFPLALVTEKAFPEDEAVIKSTVATRGPGEVANKLIYEKRFGSRTQMEVLVPFGWHELSGESETPGDWAGGIGDIAVGAKRVLLHSFEKGTIISVTGEAILPTGDQSKGFGKGVTILEPFATLGQVLPFDAFVQVQTGLEIPTNENKAGKEAFYRGALGRTFTTGPRWGRAWSPMVEFLGARELGEEDAVTTWDAVPQVQVSLSTRQHILANFGVRFPLNQTDTRDPQLLFYLLWDWFDGGLTEGW